MVTKDIKNILPDIIYCDDMYECLEDSDAMIICTAPPFIGGKVSFSVQIIAIFIIDLLEAISAK